MKFSIAIPSRRSHPRRSTARRCLPALGAVFGLLSAAHAQLMVTTTVGGKSSAAAGATVVNFDEVPAATGGNAPTNFYGSPGNNSAAPTGVYTSPASSNGTANFTLTDASSSTTAPVAASNFGGQSNNPIVTGSSGSFVTPGAGSGNNYLAIGGSNYASPNTVTMTFSNAGIHDVGLFWGSPDAYNKLTITLSDGTVQSFVPGTQTNLPGTSTSDGFNLSATAGKAAYVTFSSAGPTITSAVFSASQAAFEFDDVSFGVNAVPEPATWLGASLLLGGAGLMVRRRLRTA